MPPLPFLENQAEVEPHLLFEWCAYLDLRRDRPIGFDFGAIPWTSIDHYAARHGIAELAEFERFCRLMAMLDDAEREHVAEKQKNSK